MGGKTAIGLELGATPVWSWGMLRDYPLPKCCTQLVESLEEMRPIGGGLPGSMVWSGMT